MCNAPFLFVSALSKQVLALFAACKDSAQPWHGHVQGGFQVDLCSKWEWACCNSMRETVIREPIVADSACTRATPPESTQKQRNRYMLKLGVYKHFAELGKDKIGRIQPPTIYNSEPQTSPSRKAP